MFRFFPKERRDWLRVLVFPFQAYVVVAYCVEQYFMRSLPGGYRSNLDGFRHFVSDGYFICFYVLLSIGIAQLSAGHRLRGFLNVGLAVLAGWLGISMMSFLHT